MTPSEKALKIFFRVVGSTALLAIFAVLMPQKCMNYVHQWLGMGTMPSDPIVGYLARSTSAFYALFGALLWVISGDLRRYRRLVGYVGLLIVVFGLVLLGVDIVEGMPWFWIVEEGPLNIIFGIVILVLRRGIPQEDE